MNTKNLEASHWGAVKLPDADYVLTEGAAWIEVKGVAIRIFTTDEGVALMVYESGKEFDDPIAMLDVPDQLMSV